MEFCRILRTGRTCNSRQLSAKLAIAAGSCLAAMALLSSPANAQPIPILNGYQIDLNKVINGDSPAGSGPWMSVQITDLGTVGVDGVSIKLDPNLATGEFITKMGLNLTDAFQSQNPDPFNGLNVSCANTPLGATICSNYDYQAQVNGYSIEGNAVNGFDLGFNFTGTGQNNSLGRLTDTKTVTFNLTGTKLTAASLLGTILVQGELVNSAAKVQGISNGGSGVVGDPPGDPQSAPGPLPVLGAVAAFQASRRLRRRLKPTAAAAPRSA